jgi:hypothetical protein
MLVNTVGEASIDIECSAALFYVEGLKERVANLPRAAGVLADL